MNQQHYQFLLVSPRNSDALRINQEITRNKWYRVSMVDTASEATTAIAQGEIDCLVFNFEAFNLDKIHVLTNIREIGAGFPIIIFATVIQKEALEFAKKLKHVVIIEKPFESKDVWGICEKLVQGRKVHQRIFRRFFTDQTAAIEKTSNGEKMKANIYNLSRGGAYIELQSGRLAQPGEIINLTIHLNKVSKAYHVDAIVVWASPRGSWRGNPALGVQFVKANDVYRNLLNKL
jgi:Tfp pilus assembly protein PilZ/AmiR/NasT family two-component response regulator